VLILRGLRGDRIRSLEIVEYTRVIDAFFGSVVRDLAALWLPDQSCAFISVWTERGEGTAAICNLFSR
jgi:hypothetical protein